MDSVRRVHAARCRFCILLASVAFASCALGQQAPVAEAARVAAGGTQMVVVPGKDLKGEVFKRLGLPSQAYCWEQCLEDARCTGARWATLGASAAGQCQLLSGPLSLIAPREIKTEDGQQIRVVVGRRVARGPETR